MEGRHLLSWVPEKELISITGLHLIVHKSFKICSEGPVVETLEVGVIPDTDEP
jgi:hypothetical protein